MVLFFFCSLSYDIHGYLKERSKTVLFPNIMMFFLYFFISFKHTLKSRQGALFYICLRKVMRETVLDLLKIMIIPRNLLLNTYVARTTRKKEK